MTSEVPWPCDVYLMYESGIASNALGRQGLPYLMRPVLLHTSKIPLESRHSKDSRPPNYLKRPSTSIHLSTTSTYLPADQLQ